MMFEDHSQLLTETESDANKYLKLRNSAKPGVQYASVIFAKEDAVGGEYVISN